MSESEGEDIVHDPREASFVDKEKAISMGHAEKPYRDKIVKDGEKLTATTGSGPKKGITESFRRRRINQDIRNNETLAREKSERMSELVDLFRKAHDSEVTSTLYSHAVEAAHQMGRDNLAQHLTQRRTMPPEEKAETYDNPYLDRDRQSLEHMIELASLAAVSGEKDAYKILLDAQLPILDYNPLSAAVHGVDYAIESKGGRAPEFGVVEDAYRLLGLEEHMEDIPEVMPDMGFLRLGKYQRVSHVLVPQRGGPTATFNYFSGRERGGPEGEVTLIPPRIEVEFSRTPPAASTQ